MIKCVMSRALPALRRKKGIEAVFIGLLVTPISLMAQSNTPIDKYWVTDGPVLAVTEGSGKIYLGGRFTVVGPHTGSLGIVDRSTGLMATSFPKVNGYVATVAADGTGGWYMGGLFTRIGGIPRRYLAHVLADGRVSSWNPDPNDAVGCIVVDGRTVYVSGLFTSIGGQARNRIAALESATGNPTAWNPNANGTVNVLAMANDRIYAGGEFTIIGGQPRNRIAALHATTGNADPAWDPNADDNVYALSFAGSRLIVGGSFTSIGGSSAERLASLDVTTGLADPAWTPNPNDWISSIAVTSSTVYVAGSFTSIGGQPRYTIAALDLASGNVTPWDPDPDSYVDVIVFANGTVYAGGIFTSIGNAERSRVAALDAVSGNATSWNPVVNGPVYEIGAFDDHVAVAGYFSSVGGVNKRYLASIDAVSGAVDSWQPDPDNWIRALATGDERLYVAGHFGTIDGVVRQRIAAFNTADESVTNWNPSADNSIVRLAYLNDVVYTSGSFTNIGGQPRNGLAAIDANIDTNNATAWNPDPNGSVNAIAPDVSDVYVGGSFSQIGGQTRNYIARLSAATGLADPSWNANANLSVETLDLGSDRIFAGGTFTLVNGVSRNRIAAMSKSDGSVLAWDPDVDDEVVSVSADVGIVALTGVFTTVGGVERMNLASVAESSGNLTPWEPNPETGACSIVDVRPKKVLTGGYFNAIGGELRRGFAAFCLTVAPTGLTVDSVGDNIVELSWMGTSAPSYNIYRSRTSGGPYDLIGATSGTSHTDTSAQGGVTYYYVVRAVDECESDPSNEVSAAPSGPCELAPVFEGAAWIEQGLSPTCTLEVGWAQAEPVCGASVTYNVYRSTLPTFTPSGQNRIATGLPGSQTTYTDLAALAAGATYYYIVRAVDVSNGMEDVNEIRHSGTPDACTASAPDVVAFLTARSAENAPNVEHHLEWLNPVAGYSSTRIVYRTDGVAPTGPMDPSATLLGEFSGTAGSPDGTTHMVPDDNMEYRYAAYVNDGAGLYSSATTSWAQWPTDADARVRWSFTMGATALGMASVRPEAAYYAVSNDWTLYGMTTGASGGFWPTSWTPLALNGAVQQRVSVAYLRNPRIIGPRVVSVVAFAGAQDGHVYAIDADGTILWQSPNLGAAVQASPAAMLTDFGGTWDLVFAGSREAAGNSRFYALNLSDGTIAWSFDNGASTDPSQGIGIITAMAQVDKVNNRVYFTSRKKSGGSDRSVWCLHFVWNAGAGQWDVTLEWAEGSSWDSVDTAPVLKNEQLYVGTNAGVVLVLDPDTGSELWSFDTGTGEPIKGYVAPKEGHLIFSTTNAVWAVPDSGPPTPPASWTVPIAGTSPVLVYGGKVYIGDSDSRLHSIDVITGVDSSVALGDSSIAKTVGWPTCDVRSGHVVVGTEQGVIYTVDLF